MPDLLLELLSEEIPARMQAKAAEDLRRLVTDKLVDAGLTYEGAGAFATPRRLALTVHGVTAQSPDVTEERRGPRVDAPEKAVAGFLRAVGLSSIDETEVRSDVKKGDFYVATVRKPGRRAEEIIAEAVPGIIRNFPWPKSMRWGARSARKGSQFSGAEAEGDRSLRWVRPLRSILCMFGPETEETEIVDFEVSGIRSGNQTFGHRFMAPEPIEVRRHHDYVSSLEASRVVLDPGRRKAIIEADANTLAYAQGLEVVDDRNLLDEVAGLVEWPVVLMGSFNDAFLAIPDEVIRLTIRANQKCFVLRDPATQALTNRFLLTANIDASDGGKAIVAGNERVIAARLADARFFWDTDRAVALADWSGKLGAVTFHEKLGSQAERVERIAALARELAPHCSADPARAEIAAGLAKADLPTEMVGEFPELQGVMGRYYALEQGEAPDVADAIRDHYKPQGPSDSTPTAPISVSVAIADKLDMLVGFWAIDEKPTGSKDPYALRRAALGIVRLVLENALRISLGDVIRTHAGRFKNSQAALESSLPERQAADLLEFFADRLTVHMRDEGARHDLIDAVFALPAQDDLMMIARRVEALGSLLDSEDGVNLLAGYRRAANILRAEEARDGEGAFADPPDRALIAEPAERELFHVLESVEGHVSDHLRDEDFEAAMRSLAALRPAVDAFFDHVLVNADDQALRTNRLKLLYRLRAAMHQVADFSRVSG